MLTLTKSDTIEKSNNLEIEILSADSILDEEVTLEAEDNETTKSIVYAQPVATDDGYYMCPYCSKKYMKHIYALNHIKEVHLNIKRQRTFNSTRLCTICGESVKSYLYQTHYNKHCPELLMACDYCDKKFASKAQFKLHQVTHAENKPYLCDQCDYQTITPRQLKVSLIFLSNLIDKKCNLFICSFINIIIQVNYHVRVNIARADINHIILLKDIWIRYILN